MTSLGYPVMIGRTSLDLPGPQARSPTRTR